MGAAPYDMDRGCGRRAIDDRPYEVLSKRCVILSERSESKNLRTEGQQCRNDNAKILRRGFALLRMTEVVGNWQLLPSQSR